MKERDATITVNLGDWTETLEALNLYRVRVETLEFEISVLWQEIAHRRNQEMLRFEYMESIRAGAVAH